MLNLSMENISTSEFESNLPSDHKINLKSKRTKIIVVSIILFSFLIVLVLFLIQKIKLSKTNSNISTVKDDQAESGWVKYQNDVLGIKFIYPENWGEISTSPSNNITHLSSINKDYLDSENSDYRYMVKLNFSKQIKISFDFINDLFLKNYKFGGYNSATNWNTLRGQGASVNYRFDADKFKSLLNTGDICQYHADYKTISEGKDLIYSEKYNECKNNVKTTLIFQDSPANYIYSIKQFFYKKLNNNYFNNLLIENYITNYYESVNSNLNFEQILQKDENQETDKQLILDFEKMVNSIEVFSPPVPTQTVFQENQNEDTNITTIRKYYYLLATQKLSDAYDMYSNKNISFDDFNNQYNQVFYTNIYNINLISPNEYQFNVDIREMNKTTSKYFIIMKVNNNKIDILSSEEILSEKIEFGEYSAYIRFKLNKYEVVLIKNNIEKVIDVIDINNSNDDAKSSSSFINLKFSPKGTYLIYYLDYDVVGGTIPKIYDIINNKKIETNLDNVDLILTNDEKYIISYNSYFNCCFTIYSFPSFEIKKDNFQDIIDNIDIEFSKKVSYSYSPEKSELDIVISGKNKEQKPIQKTIKYNFINDQEVVE